MGTTNCYACNAQCDDTEYVAYAYYDVLVLCIQCSSQFICSNYTLSGITSPKDGQAYVKKQWQTQIDTFFNKGPSCLFYSSSFSCSTNPSSCNRSTSVKKGPPPVCKRCREVAEFAEPSDDFICYSCKK